MFALLVLAAFAVPVLGLLIRDQRKLRSSRQIERGMHIVSERASRRLQFRPPERSDRDFFVEMAADPVAAATNGWRGDEVHAVQSRFDDRQKFALMRGNEIVAFERVNKVCVGTATFSVSPIGPDGSRSIGVHVHSDHRNRGYGREIMAAAIVLMQYTPGPIYVGTFVTNVAMQRIMAQLGYEPEPETHPYTAPNGIEYESYWYRCGADIHPPAGLYPTDR